MTTSKTIPSEQTGIKHTETYTCAVCEGVFAKGWSDEEAKGEFKDNFEGFDTDETELVCDDCYYKMFPQFKESTITNDCKN